MDALAAYGSDSDEDSSPETTTTTTTTSIQQPTKNNAGSTSSKSGFSLSSLLPPPKTSTLSTVTPTTTTTATTKTNRYTSLPTLASDSDDDQEEESEFRKKARLMAEGRNATAVGGLLGMLPPPKKPSGMMAIAKAGLLPRTVQKPKVGGVSSTKVVKVAQVGEKDREVEEEEKEKEEEEEEEDSDSEGLTTFFPMGAATATSATTAAATRNSSSAAATASNSFIPLFFDKKPLTTTEKLDREAVLVDVGMTNEQYAYPTNEQYTYPTNDQYAYDQYYGYQEYTDAGDMAGAGQAVGATATTTTASLNSSGRNMMHLDSATLTKLGDRRTRDGPIQVIDVSGRDQMSQAQHVRMAMSGSNAAAKPVNLASINHLKPTAGQKRKHNIMSLAYQAKANEQQLNASWAASRQTKAETQSKYGF